MKKRPPYHVLELSKTSWALEHENSCFDRFDSLLDCPIHRLIDANPEILDDEEIGRYKVIFNSTFAFFTLEKL